MLQKNSVVKATRKAIESLYRGKASIYTYEEYQRENGLDAEHIVCKYSDVPCMISNSSNPTAAKNGLVSNATKEIKLFISPDLEIGAGSKIVVVQDDVVKNYSASGQPAVYPTHQEINMELWGADNEC